MIETRPDWCISRQRSWGVPIALFTCEDCGHIIINEEIEKKIVASFVQEGADAWFEHDAQYYLGKDPKCPACGSGKVFKETDILDVWFDSGASHAAVCEERPELGGQADMYLEGTDQHRGWFHSSLLESIATRGKAPFREVLTHGFVVDGDLKKMSKSLGNFITPEDLIDKYGAEIIRLWVAAEDYTGDIRISDDILKRLVESYRKVRNTSRYLLGSLADFNPDKDCLVFADLADLDRYILLRWERVLEKIYAGYKNFQFHIFHHIFLNFCINDLSSFYLDIVKDRLYSSGASSCERRSGQTAIFRLIKEMAVVMAPVLSFTADEIWDYLPSWENKPEFVFEEEFPPINVLKDDGIVSKMEKLIAVRKTANKALELSRAEKIIGHSLDADLVIGLKNKDDEADILSVDEGFARMLIVSSARFAPFEDIKDGVLNEEGDIIVSVKAGSAPKCERCWIRDAGVGRKHEGLCERCSEVLGY
jgi:isoleucyl-tRNA synthetase